jgi:hypothetical protein
VLLATPQLEQRLNDAGITAEQIEAALNPAGYLGSSEEFITRALELHRARTGMDDNSNKRGAETSKQREQTG